LVRRRLDSSRRWRIGAAHRVGRHEAEKHLQLDNQLTDFSLSPADVRQQADAKAALE
jgi:hypothetical protein